MRTYDAVVVGGGPGGLAAALWLARYRRDVLVVDSGAYRAKRVERSHGYLGRDPQSPMELIEKGRAEVLAYETASYRSDRVTSLQGESGSFRLSLASGDSVGALRVVLATGVVDAMPSGIRGIDEHYGASLFHCPSCDGFEARDRDVVALGWDARLVGFSTSLLTWACSVTLVTAGHRFKGDEACRAVLDKHGVTVIEEPAVELCGRRGDLSGVRLSSGRVLPASLAFFSVAHTSRVELLPNGATDDDGCLIVSDQGETTVPGLYAAGDVVPGLQLVSVAAAKGVVAGVACAQSLQGEQGSAHSSTPAPDVEAEVSGSS